MPKHTSWLTYLIDMFPAFKTNAQNLGAGVVSGEQPTYRSMEPVLTAFIYMVVLILAGVAIRAKLRDLKRAVVPGDKFTLSTVFEVFFGYYYDLTKEVMGPVRAREHFPLIGASAGFVTFSNLMGLVPGFSPPTSNLNVALGCAAVVFVMFNYYGFRENGLGYLGHMAGPVIWLAPLIFVIELISTCARVLTLSVRLMINMAVDHLLGATFIGLVALFVPVPVALLGLLVCFIQGLVFSLLTAVYIALATEHDESHGTTHDPHHAPEAVGAAH